MNEELDGANGPCSDAKVVSLTSTKYTVVYDGDGNLFPEIKILIYQVLVKTYHTRVRIFRR